MHPSWVPRPLRPLMPAGRGREAARPAAAGHTSSPGNAAAGPPAAAATRSGNAPAPPAAPSATAGGGGGGGASHGTQHRRRSLSADAAVAPEASVLPLPLLLLLKRGVAAVQLEPEEAARGREAPPQQLPVEVKREPGSHVVVVKSEAAVAKRPRSASAPPPGSAEQQGPPRKALKAEPDAEPAAGGPAAAAAAAGAPAAGSGFVLLARPAPVVEQHGSHTGRATPDPKVPLKCVARGARNLLTQQPGGGFAAAAAFGRKLAGRLDNLRARGLLTMLPLAAQRYNKPARTRLSWLVMTQLSWEAAGTFRVGDAVTGVPLRVQLVREAAQAPSQGGPGLTQRLSTLDLRPVAGGVPRRLAYCFRTLKRRGTDGALTEEELLEEEEAQQRYVQQQQQQQQQQPAVPFVLVLGVDISEDGDNFSIPIGSGPRLVVRAPDAASKATAHELLGALVCAAHAWSLLRRELVLSDLERLMPEVAALLPATGPDGFNPSSQLGGVLRQGD